MGSPRSPVPLFIIVPRKLGESQLGLCRLLRAELGFMLVPAFSPRCNNKSPCSVIEAWAGRKLFMAKWTVSLCAVLPCNPLPP